MNIKHQVTVSSVSLFMNWLKNYCDPSMKTIINGKFLQKVHDVYGKGYRLIVKQFKSVEFLCNIHDNGCFSLNCNCCRLTSWRRQGEGWVKASGHKFLAPNRGSCPTVLPCLACTSAAVNRCPSWLGECSNRGWGVQENLTLWWEIWGVKMHKGCWDLGQGSWVLIH